MANSSLVKMLGYRSEKELKKKGLAELFVNCKEKDRFFSLLKKRDKIKFFEVELKRKGGLPIWAAITGSSSKSALRPVPAGLEYLEVVVEDISLHKETQEKLSLERDYLQSLLDNIPDAIYFKDIKNRLIKVNKFYIQGAGGRELKKIIGKTDFDFFPYNQAKQMFKDDNYILRTGKPIIGKIERTLLSNKTWNQVITTKVPFYSKNGLIIGTMGITRDMTAYANLEQEHLKMTTDALNMLGKALEMRDPYTFKHNANVSIIAERIAKMLNWDENRLLNIRLAGRLHDLGKIGISLDILNRPGKLNEEEYQLIKKHVENCCKLINEVDSLRPLVEIIYQHHERLDGSGYPNSLKAGDILMEARILAVSDVLDAMTSHRPYRGALGIAKALEELNAGSGTRYDSKIVNIVNRFLKKDNGKIFWLSDDNKQKL